MGIGVFLVLIFLPIIYAFIYRMEEQLAKFEQRHGIAQQWQQSNKEYIDAQCVFFKEKREQLHGSLYATVSRRFYLLKMKARYSGMLFITL